MRKNIIAVGLLIVILSCGSGGTDRDTRPQPAAAPKPAAAPPQAQQQAQQQGRTVNPAYRSEFVDSLLRSFRVEPCCASPIAQCVEQKPECGAAPRLAAFVNWLGESWKYDPKMNEKQIAGWLQDHYASLTGDKKYTPDTKGWPVLGDANAPITVTLYISSFCPASKSSIRDMSGVVTDGALKGKAKIVVKVLNAIPGDKALLAAHDMGRFNELLRVLWWAGSINDATINDFAGALRFDKVKLNAAMESESVKKRLEQASAEAKEYGINRIPTYIISGRKYTSMTAQQWLTGAIELAHETETKK